VKTTNKFVRRRREATSIGSLLDKTELSPTVNPRLGRACRLYGLVVGPTLSEGSTPVALYGSCITIAVTSKALESLIQAVEGFLIKTWCERLGPPEITEVRYVLSPSIGDQQRNVRPAIRSREVTSVTTDDMIEAAATIQDEKLRQAAIEWMSVLHARTREDV